MYTDGPYAVVQRPRLGIAAVIVASVVLAASLAASVGIGLAVGRLAVPSDGLFDVEAGLLGPNSEIMVSWIAHVVLAGGGTVAALIVSVLAFSFNGGRSRAILAIALTVAIPVASIALYLLIVLATMQR